MDSRERDIHADYNLGFVMKALRLSSIVACGKMDFMTPQANYASSDVGRCTRWRGLFRSPFMSENPELARANTARSLSARALSSFGYFAVLF
jgi:hypothetical protein